MTVKKIPNSPEKWRADIDAALKDRAHKIFREQRMTDLAGLSALVRFFVDAPPALQYTILHADIAPARIRHAILTEALSGMVDPPSVARTGEMPQQDFDCDRK